MEIDAVIGADRRAQIAVALRFEEAVDGDAADDEQALEQTFFEGVEIGAFLDGLVNEAGEFFGHFHEGIGLAGRGGNGNNHATASVLVVLSSTSMLQRPFFVNPDAEIPRIPLRKPGYTP